jgi:nitroreductase
MNSCTRKNERPMLKDLILKNRSYRKFHADHNISLEVLESLVDLARITPSSKNFQPLKYALVHSKPLSDEVFQCLGWAKHLKDWNGPAENERPPSYIVMLLDKNLNQQALIDAGISAQTILLAAMEKGIGGCIIRTVDREKLASILKLPDHFEIIQVIALGLPNQEVVLTEVDESGKTNYFEKDGIHYVPKRKLKDIIYSF